MTSIDGIADSAGPRRAPAVTRAAAILELLARTSGVALGVTDIARSLSMAKSSVSYVCEALVEAGLARRDGSGYQLGHRLVSLGTAYLDSVDTVSIFHAVCRELTPSIPETAQLSTLDRLDVTYLARREGVAPVRLASDVGRRLVVPRELIEAARIDGAGWFNVLGRIAIPLARPAIAAYCSVTFLGAWNMYIWPLIIAPKPEMATLPVALAPLARSQYQLVTPNVGLAAAVLSTLPVLLVFLLTQKWYVRGVVGTGVD